MGELTELELAERCFLARHMFFFPDPSGAVVAALEMVERTPASWLPSRTSA